MSTPISKGGITSDKPELLTQVIQQARAKNDEFMDEFQESGRADKIDELENEILNNYVNSKDVKLPSISDPIQIQKILSSSQNHLSRVAEIHVGASIKVSKYVAVKNMLQNALLPLIQGGSADARIAKVNDLTQGINYMIELEEGLMNTCDLAMKNLKNAQDMASRTLKAIELDLVHFNGAEALSKIVEKTRMRNYKEEN